MNFKNVLVLNEYNVNFKNKIVSFFLSDKIINEFLKE